MPKTIEQTEVIDLQQACDLLTTIKVTPSAIYITLPVAESLREMSQTDLENMAGAILQRIAEGKRPSSTLIKQLQRIDIHTKHLTVAYVALLEAYQGMLTAPSTLTDKLANAKVSALHDMLAQMPDKMLRDFGSMQGVSAYDYVLPDERDNLIKVIVDKMMA